VKKNIENTKKIHFARNYQNIDRSIVSTKECMIKFHDSNIN